MRICHENKITVMSSVFHINLSLPVRRYLLLTPSTKGGGGGGGRGGYDLENGRLYRVQLWQIIRTISPKSCQVSMATNLRKGVFSQIFLKETTENEQNF